MTSNGGQPPSAAPQRVSGMRAPEGWTLPGKPDGLSPAAEDAWRQTGFLLGEDLRLIEAGLDAQARLAACGYAPSARTMEMAALASLWSRALLCCSDAASLVRRGAYQSAVALVRQAVEHVAAQIALPSEFEAFHGWAGGAYARREEDRAEDVGLGHYFAGEAIAADEHLRAVYRAASDLGRPNFGPAALFAAAGAGPRKYPLVFADEAFHLGWAELLLGWLLRVGAAQLGAALRQPTRFPAPPALRDEAASHVREAAERASGGERCRLEEYADGSGRRRMLLAGFRRRPGDAPRRLLL